MKEVYEFLKECQTYFLATTENNQPHVRPFGTVNIFEEKLYIQTGKTKDVSKQMQTNPKIEICALKGDEWIRINAEVVRDDSLEAKISMLDKYPSLKEMYNPNDDNTEVLYLKNATAIIYSFSHEPVKINF